MGWLDRIARAQGLHVPREPRRKASQEELYAVIASEGVSGKTSRPENVATFDQMEQIYGLRVWVYACIYTIATSCASVPIRLYKQMARSGFREVGKHPLLDLLARPNPYQSGFEFFELCWTYAEATGNVYIHVIEEAGIPVELYALRPSRVTILPDAKKKIRGYLYTAGREEIALDAYEVIHFKYVYPANDYYGLSPMAVVADEIDTSNYATKYTRNFFHNDATPGGILTTNEDIDEDQATRLLKRWERYHKKAERAHTVAVLGSGLSYQKVSSALRELALEDVQNMTRKQIQAAFGVPDIYLQAALDSTALGENTAHMQMRVFWEETLIPKLTKMWGNKSVVGTMTAELAWRFDPTLWLMPDYSNIEPLQEAIEARFSRSVDGYKNGIISLNESRAQIGFPVVDSDTADMLYQLPSVAGGAPVPIGTVERPKSLQGVPGQAYQKMIDAEIEVEDYAPGDLEKLGAVYDRIRGLVQETIEEDDKLLEAFLKRQAKEEDTLFGKLKGVFGDQEERVLKTLDARMSLMVEGELGKAVVSEKAVSPESLLPSWSEENEIMAGAIEGDFGQVYVDAGKDLLDRLQVAIDFTLLNPLVLERVKARVAWWADAVNQTTAEELTAALSEGLQAGETIEELRKRIQVVFDGTVRGSAPRARLIARTEATGLMNGGEQQAVEMVEEEFGTIWKKRWLTAGDEKVRDSHRAIGKAEAISVSQAFQLEGGPMMFPGDGSLGASAGEICNCRCTVVYEEKE